MTTEANYKTACEWWPEYPNKWTPIGWRDHMQVFSVLWNGSIVANPAITPAERWGDWKDEPKMHLHIMPGHTDKPPTEWTVNAGSRRVDDGMVLQGWKPGGSPVLWSDWAAEGVSIRAEVFGHLEGGGKVKTGREHLFAWVRLRVNDMVKTLPLPRETGVHLFLESLCMYNMMSYRNTIVYPGYHPYAQKLKAEQGDDPTAGSIITQEDGRLRLAVAPSPLCREITLFQPEPKGKKVGLGETPIPCHRLFVKMPLKKNAYVDVLLPLRPCERETFERELALGYDGALRETKRFWRQELKTATRFVTPESEVNEVIQHTPRFSLNQTETNPATGKVCKVCGCWTYHDLWTTPMALDLSMLMDPLGHHGGVRPYLAIFKEEQGTVVPPGKSYKLHRGYYSTPAAYKSVDWLADNGAVLWCIARHALLTGDAAFAREFVESMLKSCEWIKENRARTDHEGYRGVLPPAVATDKMTEIQAAWSAGWNHLGLCMAVKVLEWLEHPRAAEFAAEANSFREDYVKALRHKCKSTPTWKDAQGQTRRFIPTALMGDEPDESIHAFYLDGGPLFHVFSGLLPASDPLMQDSLAWFREGPQHRLYRRDSNCWQVPVLDHEMSSCEPCYSWNVFHSWQLGDRERYLEGMYSQFAGCHSQQTGIACETRGGISGTVFTAATYLARLAVVDDALKDGELHLLRLAPLAWLKPGDVGVYEKMPTIYGPVTVRTKVSKNGATLDVTYEANFRITPKKVILHIPPMPELKTVKVNGKKVTPKGGKVGL
jgi:hypothetical protein